MDGCQWMPHALSFGSAAPQMASSNLVKWYWKPTKPTRESFQANMQLSPEPWASSLAFQEWLNTKPCCKGPTKTTAVKSPSSCLNAIRITRTDGLRCQDGQLPHGLLRNGRHLSRGVPSGKIPEGFSKAPAKGRCEHWSRAKHHKVFDRCWPHRVELCIYM